MANADLSFGVLGTELWSTAGFSLGSSMLRRFGRRGLLAYAGSALATCRDWTTATFESEQARGLLAPWVLHTGLGPDNAVSGFMTQVIACAIQLGGMPVPVGGGVKLVDALAGIVTDAGGTVRTGAHVERIVVSGGKAVGVGLADGETVGAGRAVVAGVTPTQLYGSLLGTGDVAGRHTLRCFELPLRPRRDADPHCDGRAAAVERAGGRATCADGDGARHAGSRRRLARGQRGGARPPSGGGHDRRRAALRRRSIACARREVDPLDPAPGAACRAGSRATRRASSTSATDRGRRISARRMPTASAPASAPR